jgi:tetrahydromethanopterin S-methyltransferase subunit G
MNRAWVRHQLREQWRGRDVAVVYAVLVVVISVVAAVKPPGQLRDIVATSSTNLANLRQRPLAVLIASAFVVSPAWGLWIVAPMVVAYGALQRWLGRASVIVVGVLGQLGATLFVATMEITELATGRIGFRIGLRPDVGVSYGLAAIIGVLVVRVATAWRRRYVVMSLIVVVGQFFILGNFTGLGHVTAWLIGLAVAVPISRATRTRHRFVR